MLTYKKDYIVPYYESDANGNMKLPSIFNVALQLSGEQSMLLERSDVWLKENYNYTWIVVEYEVAINRLPIFNETISIETAARSYNKFFCYRDFIFYDQSGQVLLTITSTWVLLDFETRKVVHVADEIVAPYESEKISKIIRGHKFTALESDILERDYFVRFNDIDQNGHVNNSKYFDWMVDLLGFDFLSGHVPKQISLKYIKEVLYGVKVTSRAVLDKSDVLEAISKHEIATEELHAQAEITWQVKNG
ncbi:acyl-ACP thioesterase domain-containing protein [Lactococcus insecticola]|uniref:Acyl-ACP thioesterase n=1 Tax=Pseudolactococcus insecticola TaxID=2709158 RepID=A0A6A0B966_9LACT|nr:acyl-ACP thioesterase domain-containing protein [Lactococcus insecticola]GFH40864.1 acyl-ACP thioesterase [Lactococcus insecticola]